MAGGGVCWSTPKPRGHTVEHYADSAMLEMQECDIDLQRAGYKRVVREWEEYLARMVKKATTDAQKENTTRKPPVLCRCKNLISMDTNVYGLELLEFIDCDKNYGGGCSAAGGGVGSRGR
eukprot:scaffold163217_cov22-Tisochrysis_lutea.AAC.2